MTAQATPPVQRVAFLGLGTMGHPMARNLLEAGLPLSVWNRTSSRADDLAAAGANVSLTPAEAVADADVILTMLWDENASREVFFGKDGILEGARPGTVVVDASTTTPRYAVECERELATRGVSLLDSPVTGARQRAETGELTLMVGGDPDVLDRVRHVLSHVASQVIHVGDNGAGQLVKLGNNVTGFATIWAVCEGLGLIAAGGGPLDLAVEIFRGGTAASAALDVVGPLVLAGRFAEGVAARVAIKDLDAAVDAAGEYGAALVGAEALRHLYREVLRNLGQEAPSHAIFEYVVTGGQPAS